MRKLRATYKVGVEFTGWPQRPKPTPVLGAALPDKRWKPIDMLEGRCKGNCSLAKPPRFEKTVLGRYRP